MTAERMLQLFRGRTDYVAIPNGPGFQPHKLDVPLKPAWLEKEHLGGKRCLGFYLLTADNSVWCSAVDFDNKPDTPDPEWQQKTEEVYWGLVKFGFTPTVEISQSGTAAHVWLFFEEPIPAWLVRQFWSALSDNLGVPFVEVYPRQDKLTGKGLGNLIRYPLWNQSRFVDVEAEWITVDPGVAMAAAEHTTEVALKTVLFHMTGTTAKEPEQGIGADGLPPRVARLVSREHSLLGRRWRGDMAELQDQSKSALVLSIACELVRHFVPTQEVEQTIRVWCDNNNYRKGERDDWVGMTVAKAYDFVAGRTEDTSASATMKDSVLAFIDRLGTEERHIASGLAELDDSIDGVSPGEMAVIAARPGQGKTAFGLWWLDNAADKKIPSLIVSEEMSRMELSKRALLSITKLDFDNWEASKQQLRDDTETHYRDRAPVYCVESCVTLERLEQQVAYHTEVLGVRLVAVDYLQLVRNHHSKQYDVVTETSKRLKQMAMKHRCAVLAMCQLSRDIEKRQHPTPHLSDLRESGQIEQDADLVLFLQWPIRFDKEETDAQRYMIWCAKRRNGPIRSQMVTTVFDADRQRFGHYHTDMDWQGNPTDYQEQFA